MGSPLLKELLLLAVLLVITPSLSGQVQGPTQRWRQDPRRTNEGAKRGRGGGAPSGYNALQASAVADVGEGFAIPAVNDGGEGLKRGRGGGAPGGNGALHQASAVEQRGPAVVGGSASNTATITPITPVYDGGDVPVGRTPTMPLQYTNPQIEYFKYCETELLSDEVIGDGKISQNEFASKLVDFCEYFSVGGFQCPERRYSSLGVDLQLIFATGVCPDTDTKPIRMACLQGLANMNGLGFEFGYMVTAETMPEVQMDVQQLCVDLLPFIFADGGVTSVPTLSPSDKPTGNPTAVPTNKPTAMPTALPTATPTATPTSRPTTADVSTVEPGDDGDGTGVDTVNEDENTGSNVTLNDGDGTGVDSVNGEENPGSNEADINNAEGDNSDLGALPLIGIAAAAAACLLCCLVVACRRRNYNDMEPHKELRDLEGDESVSSDGAPNLKFLAGFQLDAMADTGDKGSITSSRHSFNKRSILPFDPTAAAAIAMGRHADDSSSARSSSIFNRSGVSGTASVVAQITKAIDKANWDEVYNLSSQMAEHEELSTLSSVGRHNSKLSSSASELNTSRDGLSPEDQERSRALDQMADHGDWTGVAVAAALYAGESGSIRGGVSGSIRARPSTPQRSFLDILTGKRGTSTAAAAFTEQDTLSALPIPYGNALGTFTDDTRSATDEPGSFDLQSPSWTLPAPSSPVLRTFTTPPPQTERSRASRAALPAGIAAAVSSSSSVSPSVHTSDSAAALGPLKGDIDRAMKAGDWEMVSMLSSQVKSNEAYHANLQAPSIPGIESNAGIVVSTPERASASGDAGKSEPTTASLKEELNRALFHGDWALVTFFASRIMSNGGKATDQDASESTTSNTIIPQSTALVPFGIQAARSNDTTDTEVNKRQTIEKLVLAEKWSGVSIMAGLYDLESKGSLPTGDAQSRALVQSDTMTVNDSSTVQSSWFGGFSAGPKAPKDSEDAGTAVNDGKSAGWTEILNRGIEAITPQKPNAPDNQILPPSQIKREEIHLRKTGNVPERQKHQPVAKRNFGSKQAPPTELRHADRVTGDIPSIQFMSAQLREAEAAEKVLKRDSQNRLPLHGTQDLIPYWKKREEKNASDDAKPAAK